MRRRNDIADLQNHRGLAPVTGTPTGLFEAEVVAIHTAQGTLDAKALSRRAVQIAARFPQWYEPEIGDRVLIAELHGDERMRVVLQAMCTKDGAAPKVVS